MLDEEKAFLGAKTLETFLEQFGDANDPITLITLEVLFEELFSEKKSVYLPSESEQERNQINSNPTQFNPG